MIKKIIKNKPKEPVITFNQAKIKPKLENIESKRKEIQKLQKEVNKIESQVPAYIHKVIENAKKYDSMVITNIDFFEAGHDKVRTSRVRKRDGVKPHYVDGKSKDGFGIDFKLKHERNDFSFGQDAFLTDGTDFHLSSIRVFKKGGKVRMWFTKNTNHEDDCNCDCDVDWR